MRRFVYLLPLCVAACATAGDAAPPRSVPIEQITRMAPVFEAAEAAAAAHGAEQVLLVFDLDSTLLRNAMQEPDIDGIKDSHPDQFRGIERAMIYLSTLVPMEPDLAPRIAALKARGFNVAVLTARGADMRDMTLRELQANGFLPLQSPECGPPLCKVRGVIPAGDVYAAARQVVGGEELAAAGFTSGRAITMADGLLTASGLDKGVLLRTVLASYPRRYAAVLFIDDAQKNVDHVARAAASAPEAIRVFHYRGPSRPEADDPRSREQVNSDWARAVEALCRAIKPRWCANDE